MLKGTAWGLPSERGERLGFLRVELLSMRIRFGKILGYITGWWFQPSEKILVSWDHYSQYMEQ
jgi:hypothetical protein